MSHLVTTEADSSRFFHDLWEIFENLPSSSESASIIFESSAFRQAAFNSIQVAPYAIPQLSHMFENFTVGNFLSTKLAFAEGFWISLASFIHNFFMASIATAAATFTLGVSDGLNRSVHKYWSHTAYALVTMLTSIAGMIYSTAGVGLNAYFGMKIFNNVIEDFRRDTQHNQERMLKKVKTLIEREGNREFIHNWLRHYYKDEKYNQKIKPSLQIIEKRIEQAQNMKMVVNLITDIRDRWPNLATGMDSLDRPNGGRNPRTAFHQQYRPKRFYRYGNR